MGNKTQGRVDGGALATTERLIARCARLSRTQCSACPMTGKCVLHARLLAQFNGESGSMGAISKVQFEVDGERCSAQLVSLDEGLATYRIHRSTGQTTVTATGDTAADEGRLSSYLEGQVRIGGSGARALFG